MKSTGNTHAVAPTKEHAYTVIFLQGRDSTATESAEEFFESQASDKRTLSEIFPDFKWVFPSSKFRNSARFETDLSQWFDIWSVEEPEQRKELQVEGLKESIAFLLDVIYREASLVPRGHIFLGGISQGCATAIHALMHCDIPVGGFIGLCSWLLFLEEIEAISRSAKGASLVQEIQYLFRSESSDSSAVPLEQHSGKSGSTLATPVFLSHAMDDDVVPISNGENLWQALDRLGMTVTWKEYKDGGHWINEPQGVDDIVAFLQRQHLVFQKLK